MKYSHHLSLHDALPIFDLLSISRLMRRYEDEKSDRYLIDFEDVLLFLVGWLESRPDVAAQVREQYRHFVVDEYQDVSPLQQRLLDLRSEERRVGKGGSAG